MPELIRMPSVAAGATHAVLHEWLIEPGATVAVGDLIAEIETDKAVIEYAAEVAGELGRFLVQAGDSVPVGDPIAVVLAPGEDASALLLTEEVAPEAVAPGPLGPAPSAPSPSAGAASTPAPAASPASGRRFVSPVARRVAAERGVDLATVQGSGPNGRIVRRDVEAAVSAPAPGASAGPVAAAASVAAPSSVPVPPAAGAGSDAYFRDEPLTGMRRAIARRLTESKSTVPHFYMSADVRMDALLALRAEVNESAPRKISVNDFIVKAVAGALQDVPEANGIWNGDSIRYFDTADIGIAIAVPGGLLTPVLRGVSGMGVLEVSRRIADFADRARAGRIQQGELEGGSFAVSNLGMYGVDSFSAIINPPQAGILAVSAAKRRPVVAADDSLSVATVMTVTLSADHRVIDGAVAAGWCAALVGRLEAPLRTLI